MTKTLKHINDNGEPHNLEVDNSKPTKQFTPYDFVDDNGNPKSFGTPIGHAIIDEVLPENDPDFKGIIIRSKE